MQNHKLNSRNTPHWLRRGVRPQVSIKTTSHEVTKSLVTRSVTHVSCWRTRLLLLKLRLKLLYLQLHPGYHLRMFIVESDLIRRRLLLSLNFLAHRQECALYFRLRGRPLDKPAYIFKMFDKFHSMMWPNEKS